MKKILKSELTPQLVKHQEATLQLFNIQRDIIHQSFPSDASAREPHRRSCLCVLPTPPFLPIMKTEFVGHQESVDMMLCKP